MGYLVVFVLDNPDRCQDVLDSWENVGAKGITILESTGIGRVRQVGMQFIRSSGPGRYSWRHDIPRRNHGETDRAHCRSATGCWRLRVIRGDGRSHRRPGGQGGAGPGGDPLPLRRLDACGL